MGNSCPSPIFTRKQTSMFQPVTDTITFTDVIERMIEANNDDKYAQALIVFDEFLKRHELQDEVSSRIGPELLRRMHSNLRNENLQKRGERCCDKVIGVIQDFIKEHSEDAYVARFGLELTWYALRHYYRVPHKTFDLAVDCMIRHENDPVVQVYAIRCVAKDYDRNRNMMDDGQEGNIDDPGVLHVFLQAMRNHPDNSDLQLAACDNLYKLFDFGIILQQQQDYIEAILQALQTHPTNEKVQGKALRALALMMQESASLNRIIQAGGVDLLVPAMQLFERETAHTAVFILSILVGYSTYARRRAFELGAVPMLLNIWRQEGPFWNDWNDRNEILSVYNTLNELFLDNIDSAVSLQIANEGAIDIVVEKVVEYVNWCPDLFELKDGDILAHLAMFPADDGKLALHYAADWVNEYDKTGRMAVLEHLLKLYPKAATVRDGSGRLPLHIAVMFPADDGKLVVVRLTCDRSRRVIIEFPADSDKIGRRAIVKHVLKGHRDSPTVVLEFPADDAVDRGKKSDKTGRMAVLERLLKVYPEAATVRDGSGRLPLHIAIESRASLSVLEVLLRANPDAGEAVCHCPDGIMLNFPPVLMAAASDCHLECIFALLRHAPTILRRDR